MTDLTAEQFPAFFKAVHGYEPHPWQERLLRQVLDTGWWPGLLDLPTGVGKTSVVDIALFALAVVPDQFPRRIVFVIDRRLIVDQVGERASQLQEALATSQDPVVRQVAGRLHALSGNEEGEQVIGVTKLRGGVRDQSWAQRPDTPWIIVSTVDQIGSRLLFRGYGVSEGMRPIHAGLAANDTLLLLDEVHISQAFASTLGEITSRYRNGPEADRWQVVEMSATPSSGRREAFKLEPGDHDPDESEMIHQITSARKPVELVPVGKKQQDPGKAIGDKIVELVGELATFDSIAIVVNRVATALAVTKVLFEAGFEPLLLTGRMRPYERVRFLDDPRFLGLEAGAEPPEPSGSSPTILVSTQAIEVGADLDVGAMITECAPADSLRQRFGRVDRRGHRSGRNKPAEIRILGVHSAVRAAKPPFDPVYGSAVQETWKWLSSELDSRGALDAGIRSGLWSNPPEATLAPTEDAPLLLPSHLDLFVQTSPEPVHQPAPALWLHGTAEVDTDVRVVWRADVDEWALDRATTDQNERQQLGEVVAFRPPRDAEALAVPIGAARKWLAQSQPSPVADINSREPEAGAETTSNGGRPALRWSPSETKVVRAADLVPGELIIVPATYGGLDRQTWSPASSEAVADLADLIESAAGLTPDDPLGSNDAASLRLLPAHFVDVPVPRPTDVDAEVDELELIRAWAHQGDRARTDHPYRDDYDELLNVVVEGDFGVERYTIDGGQMRFLIHQKKAPAGAGRVEFDASDEVNSMTGTAVSLQDHLEGVEEVARKFAKNCGLPAPLIDDLALAGRLHDLGKLDPRFQIRLHNDDVLAAASATEPLAKSSGQPRNRRRSTAQLAPQDRYPAGARHELLTLSITDTYPRLLEGANDRDLVCYLIATHHGFCRPFAPPQSDSHPLRVKERVLDTEIDVRSTIPADQSDARVADRFWRLVRRHGWYRLAWYEAIFRLADHRRSQWEKEAGSNA